MCQCVKPPAFAPGSLLSSSGYMLYPPTWSIMNKKTLKNIFKSLDKYLECSVPTVWISLAELSSQNWCGLSWEDQIQIIMGLEPY